MLILSVCSVIGYVFVCTQEHGLPTMQGVVFLDALDRKRILVRASMKVMPLEQSGIDKANRFSFYDQIHTTGYAIALAHSLHLHDSSLSMFTD
jgi:hypothetical protein